MFMCMCVCVCMCMCMYGLLTMCSLWGTAVFSQALVLGMYLPCTLAMHTAHHVRTMAFCSQALSIGLPCTHDARYT